MHFTDVLTKCDIFFVIYDTAPNRELGIRSVLLLEFEVYYFYHILHGNVHSFK